MIDQRYHKAIIGAQGANIRDIREKFSSVVISFPDPGKQSDVVSLRGPKNYVDQCYKYLHQIAQDMVLLCIMLQITRFLQIHMTDEYRKYYIHCTCFSVIYFSVDCNLL